MTSRLAMPRLPQPTATRMPGLIRFGRLDASQRRRTSPATSATLGWGDVCRSEVTCGKSTGRPFSERRVGEALPILADRTAGRSPRLYRGCAADADRAGVRVDHN